MRIVMIEPVGSACNLRCKYCYQDPVRESGFSVMSQKILEKVIKENLDIDNNVRFLWHGGEPMLAGIDFFKKACEIQQSYKKQNQLIENRIQTNATLIDEKWAKFFTAYSFKVGTSLDGPNWLHNLTRPGSYRRTIEGIRNIRMLGRGVGVIITVTKYNVDYPWVIWEELIKSKEITTSWDINICSATELSRLTPSDEKSIQFLKTLFDLWFEYDDPKIRINTFHVILRSLLGGNAGDCVFDQNKCHLFSAIDEKGDVYICNRFLKRDVAYLGNAQTHKLQDIFAAKETQELYRKISKINFECKTCEWLFACGGGCAFQRWLGAGRFDAGLPECSIRKVFFAHVQNKIKKSCG